MLTMLNDELIHSGKLKKKLIKVNGETTLDNRAENNQTE